MGNIIKDIINDTLKKEVNGKVRWSRTSLTMFSAWFISLTMAIIDFGFNGLRFDVWFVLIGVAMGSKITDSYSKKLHK